MQNVSNTAQVDQSDIKKFRFGALVQGNDSVTVYYSKLKRCNEVVKFSEDHLKHAFIRGLTPENEMHVRMFGLMDEMVEIHLSCPYKKKYVQKIYIFCTLYSTFYVYFLDIFWCLL